MASLVPLLTAMQQTPPPTSSSSDAVHLAKTLGISAAEAESRLRLADRLGIFQLRVRSDPDFAGAYLEHEPKFQAVVMFRGDAAERLKRYVSDDAFTPRSVEFSLRELVAAEVESRDAFRAAGLGIISTEKDIEANRVLIHVADDKPAKAAITSGKLKLPKPAVIDILDGNIATEPQKAGPVAHFPQARDPAIKEMRALMTGKLFETNGCLRIGNAADEGFLVIWPSSARLSLEKGTVVVSDGGDGKLTVGNEVSIGGGGSTELPPPGHLLEPVAARCSGPYWIASRHW